MVLTQQLGLRDFVHLFKERISKYGPNLHLGHSFLAFWALKIALSAKRLLDNHLEALFVYHVHALCEDGVLLLHLFIRSDVELA